MSDLPESETLARGYKLDILLVSFSALLIEISYTRVVSFKLFYYYTYLVIGLALLGIGCGGVLVAISKRVRRAETDVILMWSMLLGGVSVGLGYLVVAWTSIDTLAIWDYGTLDSIANVGRLLLICLALFASFIAVGVVIATLFARGASQIGRLYFADLVGAGIACAVVVSLLGWIGPPATILLAGTILAALGVRIAARRRERMLVPAGAVVAVLLGVAVIAPSVLPEPRTDAIKVDVANQDPLYSSWSPLFRVDVFEPAEGTRLLFHDGLVGSGIYEYDGDPASLTRFEDEERSLPFDTRSTPPDDVLIIGAAGGNEILASLFFDAGHIDAVELNPVTYDLVTDEFADFAGRIAEDPRVNYVNGEGRNYLARSNDEYDLIWFPAPDSYSAAASAANAGAFVLSESYLYTSEIIQDSLEHLRSGGILATQYGEFDYATKPNRTSRYVATARHALEERGIDDPSDHILVATVQPDPAEITLSTILVKEEPFTPAEVRRFLASVEQIPGGALQYAPGHPVEGSPVSELATLSDDDLDAFYADYPYDISPITDDGPFFWHFTPFADVIADFADPIDPGDFEDTVGERVLLLLLGIAFLFAGVFLLLPFFAIRDVWTALPRKGTSALYFAALGLGFIFIEITLIQRLTLFLGYPTYSLTVTLASILLFTGVGAYLSGRYEHRPRRVVPVLFGAIVALVIFYLFALTPITEALLGWPLGARILVAFLVLAPLGVCLGAFMPLGLGAVSRMTEYPREYVAWGWAVNGFASVIGSVLTTIVAMTYGFRVVLVLSLVIYLVAIATLMRLLRSTPAATPAGAVPERAPATAAAAAGPGAS